VDFKKEKVLLELVSIDKKACIQCDQAFPVALQCVDDANNPAVYIVTNLVGSGPDKQEQVAGSLHWHNDIEFELNLVPITRLYRHANEGSTQEQCYRKCSNWLRRCGFWARVNPQCRRPSVACLGPVQSWSCLPC
jgi:hypothetical protein